MSVAKAQNDIDRLTALRDRLAVEIDLCDSAPNIAVLTRQFLAVLADLAELQPSAPSRVDEIAEKYAKKLTAIRSADTPRKAPARRKAQPG